MSKRLRCTYDIYVGREPQTHPRRCEKAEGHKGAHTFGIEHPDRVVVARIRYPEEGEAYEEIVEVLD